MDFMRIYMKRGILLIFIFSIFISSLFSQGNVGSKEIKGTKGIKETKEAKETKGTKETIGTKETKDKEKKSIGNMPAQALFSNKLYIPDVNFNRVIDVLGKGEILEVEFTLMSKIDDPQDIYIHVIATFENKEQNKSSFLPPIPEEERIRSFVPYPDKDKKNYEYTDPDKKDKIELIKYPKNPKTGIDPNAGKPYHLQDLLHIRTKHLSKYRNNYFFFNYVTILIFDKDGSPIYRQVYELSGRRT